MFFSLVWIDLPTVLKVLLILCWVYFQCWGRVMGKEQVQVRGPQTWGDFTLDDFLSQESPGRPLPRVPCFLAAVGMYNFWRYCGLGNHSIIELCPQPSGVSDSTIQRENWEGPRWPCCCWPKDHLKNNDTLPLMTWGRGKDLSIAHYISNTLYSKYHTIE